MRKSFLYPMWVGLFGIMVLFASCSDHDDEGLYVQMGTVGKNAGLYELALDYERTYPMPDSTWLVRTGSNKPGQRVIAFYNYVERDGTQYPGIDVRSIYKVLTKPFFRSPSQAQSDSIGNNGIELKRAWIVGGYLNIYFEYLAAYYGGTAHYISMVTKEKAPDENGFIELEFRHNQCYDSREVWRGGYVSFILKPEDTPKGTKGYLIRYPDIYGTKRVCKVYLNEKGDGLRGVSEETLRTSNL